MSCRSPQVLVIEDDPAIARVLERNLTKCGLQACVAANGRDALNALADQRFDFVLCDFQLPDTTGDVLCRSIRSSTPHAHIPLALCTAKAHEVDVAALIVELDLTNVFYKPFSIREITAAICSAVNSAGTVTPAG